MIKPRWIPREHNQIADAFSKIKDSDNWSIDDYSFNKIIKIFGKVYCDRFADNLNKKVDTFNSKFFCPGSDGVDTFTKDWSHCELNWLCPPIKLIPSCIEHLMLCKAKGILIVPEWPSSFFWPKLFGSKLFNSFIKHVYVFEPFYYTLREEILAGI